MKKLFTVWLVLCLAIVTKAQVKVDDFESGNKGWGNVACGGDLIANEYKSGINLSDYVYCALRVPACENWSGCMISDQVYKGYRYLHAYMYRNNTNKPNLKVSDTNPQDLEPINDIVAYQWQDVVWDINDYISTGTEFIFFMVDRTDITVDAWMLIDEVLFSNDPTPRTKVVGGDDDYELVWNADFVSATLPANWNIEVNDEGGGNNELQYYCAKGVSMGKDPQEGKHCLILTATKEDYLTRKCTSGRVNTLEHTYLKYGKIEARIWFPNTANGLWPAFWMMGNDINDVGWPACGETDIVELGNAGGFGGNQDRYFNGASHWGPDWQNHYQDANVITNSYSVEDGFHIFTCIWTPQKVAMYVDKEAYPNVGPYYEKAIPASSDQSAPGYYFHKPNFIILNLAVGGDFPQIWDINGITALAGGPRSMYIDWVRIYQRGDASESFVSNVASEAIEDVTSAVDVINQESECKKILHEGQVLILRGGHVYTLTGQIIK